jgi:hypothetical protein
MQIAECRSKAYHWQVLGFPSCTPGGRSGVTYSIVNILGRWDRDVILKKLVPISPEKPSASSKIKRGGNMGNIVIEVRDELGTTH